MEDTDIVELYWQRSGQAIAATDEKYGPYCRSIAYRICRCREDADECVSDTWLSAWNAMPDKRPERLAPFLGRIARNHALHRVESQTRQKRGGGAWIDPARMTSLMSYRVLDREHPYEEHLPEATEADIWALIGTDGFLLDEQSYIHTAVRWDTGAWQCKVVYGSSGYDLTYVPKGSFCPVLRELLHPDAEGWAYETACGEQVYMAPDGEMEYPRFQTPLALYETDTAYLLLSPDGANDAGTMQLFADSIDFTKFS